MAAFQAKTYGSVHCDHCEQFVSRKTAYNHRKIYRENDLFTTDQNHGHSALESDSTKPTQGKIYCSHCKKFVSRKTAFNHSQICHDELEHRVQDKQDKKPDLVWCTHCNMDVSRKTRYIHLRQQERDITLGNKRQRLDTSSTESDSDLELPKADESASTICDQTNTSHLIPDQEFTISEEEKEDSSDSESVWDEEDDSHVNTDLQDSRDASPQDSLQSKAKILVTWILVSLVFIQCTFYLSNRCVEQILILLSQLFTVLSHHSELCATIASVFPVSMYMVGKLIDYSQDDFTKYVVCPNCCSLHSYEDVLTNGKILCKNKIFACRAVNSSRKRGRAKCNANLARRIILKNGEKVLYPYKIYCFKGVVESLQKLLNRSDFIDKCHLWRQRNLDSLYADVYDGQIWQSFINKDGSDFLTEKYHFGVALNVDWFCPYKRRRDLSIGAIYMVIQNLPREERYKTENVLLLGIIPSMKKEPNSLNSFLEPIVNELKALWRGVLMTVHGSNVPVTVKLALMCAAADIPAARKLCGFLGHSASQGCSSCTKPLIRNSKHDCGVPDEIKWPKRNREDHLKFSKMAEDSETLTAKNMIEGRYGYRHTELLKLSYFNPSTFYAVDPMHNLFLGTAKKLFTHWVDTGLISKSGMASITDRIDHLNIDSNLGRIPRNISSNYSQMTAMEWKNWVLVYSMYSLKNSLPLQHLRVWQTFVLACKHICKPIVSDIDVEIAHNCFVKFVREVGSLYGSEFVTPNMHLHCHLRESVRNFGSIYGFWLFSFERYNGMLTDYPTNKRSIELQLMRKFELSTFLNPNSVHEEYHGYFLQLRQNVTPNAIKTTNISLIFAPIKPISDLSEDTWQDLTNCSFRHEPYKITNLSRNSLENLACTYGAIYKRTVNVDMLGTVAKKYRTIEFMNDIIRSREYRQSEGDIIWAAWADNKTQIEPQGARPARVRRLFVHSIELETGDYKQHVFAEVDWFRASHETIGYLPPVTVWSAKHQNDGPATFLPIQRILCRGVWTYDMYQSSRFLVASQVHVRSFV